MTSFAAPAARRLRAASFVLLAGAAAGALALACGSTLDDSAFDDGDAGRTFSVNAPGEDAGFGTEGGLVGRCAEEAKLVYVLSADYDLYSFEPSKLAFRKIGKLDCPSGNAQPNSMAVDRTGRAWVNYDDGSIYWVSTKDASCQASPYEKGQLGWTRFGMAFSSDGDGTEEETLFLNGVEENTIGKGLGLAKVDPKTLAATRVGLATNDLAGVSAELTGTGDGRLFGFFTTVPQMKHASLDKATGATGESTVITSADIANARQLAWAFSFWGGDFWFYTSRENQPSKVTRYRTSDDRGQEVVVPDVGGFRIVGAGVSTCAPTTPPVR